MNESKIELTERLRQEGRWGEASRFKDEVLRECRAKGMKKAEAAEAAWEATADAFPPLPTNNRPDFPPVAPEGEAGDELADAFDDGREMTHDLVRDVFWAYNHLGRRVVPKDAPSPGAWSLLEYAREYRKPFFENLVPRAMAAQSKRQEESAEEKRERVPIAEIERIIKDIDRQWEEKLLADVPGTVREGVRSRLDDWARRFHLDLAADARTSLEAHIGELVHKSVEAIRRAPGDVSAGLEAGG
jgi:hypothetical protein